MACVEFAPCCATCGELITDACAGVLPDCVPHDRLGPKRGQVVLRIGTPLSAGSIAMSDALTAHGALHSRSPGLGPRSRTSRPPRRGRGTRRTRTTSRSGRTRSTWATAGGRTSWATVATSGTHSTSLVARRPSCTRTSGASIYRQVRPLVLARSPFGRWCDSLRACRNLFGRQRDVVRS